MKSSEPLCSTTLTFTQLDDLEEELAGFSMYETDYPSINDIEIKLVPDFLKALEIENKYTIREKNNFYEDLKENNLEEPIFYIKYLMWMNNHLDSKKEDEKKLRHYIQKFLYEYLKIEE